MDLTFKKLANRWFYDIPYDGDINDLEMVLGADKLIESIPSLVFKGIKIIEIVPNKTDCELRKLEEDEFETGCTYYADTPFFKGEIWLCAVTKTVLGKYPDVINFIIV